MQELVDVILVPLSIVSVGNLGLKLSGNSVLPAYDKTQSFALSLALGVSILSVTGFTLNLAQADVRPFFWAFYYVGIAFGIFWLGLFFRRRRFRFEIRALERDLIIPIVGCLAVIVLATGFLIALSALNQRNDWDAVQLYLPMGKILFENGLLPIHSQEIGRDIVNFFLGAYAYGYAMTISGSFLFPRSLLGIVSINLFGFVAATYCISLKILKNAVQALLAAAFSVTLPVMAYYFSAVPHYVDIPSVFLAFALILCVFNRLNTSMRNTKILVSTNIVMGIISFTCIGFKLQNLLVMAPITVLLIASLGSPRRKLLALASLASVFVIALLWALTYGTVLSGLSSGGDIVPVVVVIGETSTLLILLGAMFIRDKFSPVTGLRSFIPGIIGGYAAWFVRPTLIESTPFFPASLPSSPEFAFARNAYSSISSSLFNSPLSQYGLAAPYLGPYVAPLLLPLVAVGLFSLFRRSENFTIEWIVLVNAASIFLTGYVDIRYALWVAPLSGLLVGESVAFLNAKLKDSRTVIWVFPLLLMSLGLGVDSDTPTLYHHILPILAVITVASSVYASLLLWRPIRSFTCRMRSGLSDSRLRIIGTILLLGLGISLLSVTYGTLFVYDRGRDVEPQYQEVYLFLEDHVPRGSTVLSIGFPAIYYRVGLNSIPMDDPEGLAQLYAYTRDTNSTIAVERLKSQMRVSSIIVPTDLNEFWYEYFEGLKSRVPLLSALTSEPLSHSAFVGLGYQVYLIS